MSEPKESQLDHTETSPNVLRVEDVLAGLAAYIVEKDTHPQRPLRAKLTKHELGKLAEKEFAGRPDASVNDFLLVLDKLLAWARDANDPHGLRPVEVIRSFITYFRAAHGLTLESAAPAMVDNKTSGDQAMGVLSRAEGSGAHRVQGGEVLPALSSVRPEPPAGHKASGEMTSADRKAIEAARGPELTESGRPPPSEGTVRRSLFGREVLERSLVSATAETKPPPPMNAIYEEGGGVRGSAFVTGDFNPVEEITANISPVVEGASRRGPDAPARGRDAAVRPSLRKLAAPVPSFTPDRTPDGFRDDGVRLPPPPRVPSSTAYAVVTPRATDKEKK